MSLLGVFVCLWSRHRWEILSLVVISLLVSILGGKLFLDSDSLAMTWHGLRAEGLILLEVALVVLVTARIVMSEGGFGCFDGWQSRPVRAWVVWLGGGLLLCAVFLPLLLVRLLVVAEVLSPSQEGWRMLWQNLWKGMLLKHSLVVILAMGLGWVLKRIGGKARVSGAWVSIGALVVIAWASGPFSMEGSVLRSRGGSGGEVFPLRPENSYALWKGGRWLGKGWDWEAQALVPRDHPDVVTLPLQKGAEIVSQDLKVQVRDVHMSTDFLRVTIEVRRAGGLSRVPMMSEAMVVRYGNGFFGVPVRNGYGLAGEVIPFLPLEGMRQKTSFLSPRMLPENEATVEELLAGAEISLLLGSLDSQSRSRLNLRSLVHKEDQKETELAFLLNRADSNLRNRPDRKTVRKKLEPYTDPESQRFILQRGPYSQNFWEQVLMPVFVGHVDKSHKSLLLEKLKWSPVYGELMVRQGWGREALPQLKSHAMAGRPVGVSSLLALIGLGEVEMGEMLERQVLSVPNRDLSRVFEAVEGHPAMSVDRIKQEGWRRTKFGFGGDHVRVLWGAEMGDKEALRQMLAKSLEGKKWEKEILDEWFAEEGGVAHVSQNWEKVDFKEGRWMVSS